MGIYNIKQGTNEVEVRCYIVVLVSSLGFDVFHMIFCRPPTLAIVFLNYTTNY